MHFRTNVRLAIKLFCCIFGFLFCLPLHAKAETITIAGTGDSQHLLGLLAEAYQQSHPDAQILIPNSVGSGGGVKLLLAGRSEFARLARPLKPKETVEDITYWLFAYSPVVFVANLQADCAKDISREQLIDIFTGKISSWNQMGSCPDHKIYIASRESGDSSRTILESKISGFKQIASPLGRPLYSTPEAVDTLLQHPFSFGYLPLAQTPPNLLTIFTYEGIAATPQNIQQGSYPLAVPLGLAWLGTPQGLAKEFLDFLATPQARRIMKENGAVPATANE